MKLNKEIKKIQNQFKECELSRIRDAADEYLDLIVSKNIKKFPYADELETLGVAKKIFDKNRKNTKFKFGQTAWAKLFKKSHDKILKNFKSCGVLTLEKKKPKKSSGKAFKKSNPKTKLKAKVKK